MPAIKFSKQAVVGAIVTLAVLLYAFPDGATFLVCFFLGGGVMLFVASKVIGALLAPSQKLHAAFLGATGLRPCSEAEQAALHAQVAALKRWRAPDTFRLGDPVQGQLHGKPVHQFYFSDAGRPVGGVGHSTSRGAVREFELLAPFPRRSPAFFVAVLGPDTGLSEKIQAEGGPLAAMMAGRWSSAAHPVEVLPLPPELAGRGVATLLGAPDTSATELITPDELSALATGAEVGVDQVIGADGRALFTFQKGYVTEAAYARLPAWLNALAAR